MGESPPSLDQLRAMVGHGLDRLLERCVGAARAGEGVRLFRERFPLVAVEKSHLLPGVAGVLASLAGAGYVMALASNKPPRFSQMILEAKGVAGYFTRISGPDARHPPKPDPAMLWTSLEAMGVTAAAAVCVGDMEVDVEFARAGGCRVVLVPTGSRPRVYLEGAGGDRVIDDLTALPAALEDLD